MHQFNQQKMWISCNNPQISRRNSDGSLRCLPLTLDPKLNTSHSFGRRRGCQDMKIMTNSMTLHLWSRLLRSNDKDVLMLKRSKKGFEPSSKAFAMFMLVLIECQNIGSSASQGKRNLMRCYWLVFVAGLKWMVIWSRLRLQNHGNIDIHDATVHCRKSRVAVFSVLK